MSIEFIDSKKLTARIEELKEELAKLLHLESFLGPKSKKGRKPASTKATKKSKRGRKKGGMTVKDTILAVLEKGPATSKEIIAKVGGNKTSVAQAIALLKKTKVIKQGGKKGSPYSIA